MTEPAPLPFSPEVLAAYVGAIRQAYEANGDKIDPEIGHNEGSFRYLVYQTTTFFLPGAMRGLSVEIEQDNNALVVREGGRGLRAYPIGTSEFDNPWESFPTNRGGAPAAAALNRMQMPLFDEATLHPRSDGLGTEYILGHCGTSIDGLRAVHLCLPVGFSSDETVRQWAWVRTIFRAGTDEMPAWVPTPGPVPIAPIVVTPQPVVALRADEEHAADVE